MMNNANGNEGVGGGFSGWWLSLALLILLALSACFLGGMWYGGWIESVKLRSALEVIPDLNQCYQ